MDLIAQEGSFGEETLQLRHNLAKRVQESSKKSHEPLGVAGKEFSFLERQEKTNVAGRECYGLIYIIQILLSLLYGR